MTTAKEIIEELHAGFVRLVEAINPEHTPEGYEAARLLWCRIPAKNTLEENGGPPYGRWPDQNRPGVPPNQGWHWVMWPSTGVLMCAQYDGVGVIQEGEDYRDARADLDMWVQTYLGCFVDPKDMAHLDYIGPATPPVVDGYLRLGPQKRPSLNQR